MPDRTIDPRYIPTTVTVAANVLSTAPTSTNPNLGSCIVESVNVFIPPGHAGLTGLAVQLAGVHVVPYGDNTAWVIGDDASLDFELGVEVGADLRILTYNVDLAFSHAFYLRWKIRSVAPTSSDIANAAPGATVLPIIRAG